VEFSFRLPIVPPTAEPALLSGKLTPDTNYYPNTNFPGN